MGDADPRRTVFLSYARSDQEQAARLTAALEASGLNVWWDKLIEGGAVFTRSIESSLDSCDAVVVCWSRGSVASDWVLDEAGRGRDLHKLVPVTLDGSEPPIGFRQYHAIDLSRWGGAPSDASIAAIVRGVGVAAGRAARQVENAAEPVRVHQGPPAGARGEPVQWRVQRLISQPRALIFTFVVAVALALIGALAYRHLPSFMPSVPGSTPSIAVLPFDNLSGDPNSDHLGDGLSEELLNRLANVPGLQVAARKSSAYFKDRTETAENIGRMLGVDYLIEGSVRRSGNTLRVSAQLIDTDNGYHMWSESFDRPFSDVLQIQDEISLAVLKGLDVPLIDKARAAALKHVTASPEALDLYLQARRADQEWKLEQNDRAIALYEQAIALDPDFAAAHAALANSLINRQQIAEVSYRDPIVARAAVLARQAVALDPASGEARALLGKVMWTKELDPQAAEKEFRLAEHLSPNSAATLEALYEFQAQAGWPPEKGFEYAQRWRKIDPLNPMAEINVSTAEFHLHRYDDALRTLEPVLQRQPDNWMLHFNRDGPLLELGRFDEALASARRTFELHDAPETRTDLVVALALSGQEDEARRELAILLDPVKTPYYAPSLHAWAASALNDVEAALSALERAHGEGDWVTFWTLHSRMLLPLHDEPRFHAVVRQFGQERRVAYMIEKTKHLPPWPH